jgi:hypothetical protein
MVHARRACLGQQCRCAAGIAGAEADLAVGKARKGTVLLDPRIRPRATHNMRALAVLTNGQWPPRGLVSGRWPPQHACKDAPLPNESPLAAATPRRARTPRTPKYSHIIHCGGTRQAAGVVSMQEVQHDFEGGYDVMGVNMAAACAAAAVLTDGASSGHEDDDSVAGALVDVTFRFSVRREWIVPGMRFVVRDQLGHVSGVGVVQSPLLEQEGL